MRIRFFYRVVFLVFSVCSFRTVLVVMILKKDGFSRFVFGRIFRMVLILWLLVNIFSLFFRRKYFRVFKDREKI